MRLVVRVLGVDVLEVRVGEDGPLSLAFEGGSGGSFERADADPLDRGGDDEGYGFRS